MPAAIASATLNARRRLARDPDLAAGRRDHAAQHLHQRRFAGPVLADQPDHLAAAHAEAHPVERDHAWIGLANLAQLEQRFGHRRIPGSRAPAPRRCNQPEMRALSSLSKSSTLDWSMAALPGGPSSGPESAGIPRKPPENWLRAAALRASSRLEMPRNAPSRRTNLGKIWAVQVRAGALTHGSARGRHRFDLPVDAGRRAPRARRRTRARARPVGTQSRARPRFPADSTFIRNSWLCGSKEGRLDRPHTR